ncbi:MAG TPA: KGK domain-containing protein [Kamptonema sp.]|nr:KGK domain-containing protein [Kamptonema sp.]
MNSTNNLLNSDDVLSASASALMFQCTFKVSELMTILQSKISDEELFIEGIDCEVLSPGKNWRKGKVRLRLEFTPDLPEAEDKTDSLEPGEDTVPGDNNGYPTTDNGQESLEPSVDNSTPIYNPLPVSMYPDGHPGSVGMWS